MFNYLSGNGIISYLQCLIICLVITSWKFFPWSIKGYGFVIVQATPQQVLNNFSFFSLKDNLLSSISTFD